MPARIDERAALALLHPECQLRYATASNLALSTWECQIDIVSLPYGGSSHEAQAPGRPAHRAGDRGGGDHREWPRPARHREGEAAEGPGHRRGRRQVRRG